MNSSNIVIKSITWIGCGNSTKNDANQVLDHFTEMDLNVIHSPYNSEQHKDPVIDLQFSINVTIQNCVFHYSKGRAVVMSELSGDVTISHCDFLNNSHYRDHGAAIHYSSNNNKTQCLLTINDCNFADNKFAKSLLYIVSRTPVHKDKIIIYNSKFYYNEGVSIHVTNHKLHLTGKN